MTTTVVSLSTWSGCLDTICISFFFPFAVANIWQSSLRKEGLYWEGMIVGVWGRRSQCLCGVRKKREINAYAQLFFFVFPLDIAWDPSPWDCTTHIYDESSLLFTCLNTLLNTPSEVSSTLRQVHSIWQWCLAITPLITTLQLSIPMK